MVAVTERNRMLSRQVKDLKEVINSLHIQLQEAKDELHNKSISSTLCARCLQSQPPLTAAAPVAPTTQNLPTQSTTIQVSAGADVPICFSQSVMGFNVPPGLLSSPSATKEPGFGSSIPSHFMSTLKSMMNVNNEMQVRAAGGLLEILQEEMLIDPIKHNDYETNVLQIHSILEISMDKLLTLDFATYGALQIFQNDKHPSDMGIGKAKEGFSLFGIFADKCVTLMGRHLLRTWFLRPILDLDVVNDRLDFIAVFLNLDEVVAAFHHSLKHAKDIPRLLKRFSSPSSLSTRNDWQQLLKTIGSYLHLRDIVEVSISQRQYKQAMRKLHLIQKILSVHSEDLVRLNDMVTGALDFDQTCGESSDTMIAKGVCDEVASLELKRLPKQNSCIYVGSIVYLPQIGYLMCLSGRKLEVEVLQDLPDFEFVFASGTNDEEECFYRTSKTKELDAMLGDIHHKILDMERAILRDLEFRIGSSSSSLIKMAGLAAEFDCLLAFTSIARECKYVRPNFSEENIINIKNGRHPLQELVLDTFVPNDTDCSNTGHVNIVTGPNYSGKSVYVKQVALIAFLSHIGSFVPAEQATIGLLDRIFSGVACKHTITLQESTFMMDLHQVSIMLRNSTVKSLCILDEFGKGTLNTDGIGILCSTLEYFAKSAHPPRVFACTHFSEVFDEFFLRKLKNIQYFTMSVLERCSANGGELQDIIFLYRLVPGRVLPSYGLHCAELAGVPQTILDRAREIVGLIQEGKSIERIRTNEMSSNDSYYKGLMEKLLNFDCNNGDLDSFLKDVFSFDTNAANPQ
ncbi:hypothetical protein L7F22_059032 [Adiantum nelumboides]|nr:hypothetical protein [Adiantum nelumboides]